MRRPVIAYRPGTDPVAAFAAFMRDFHATSDGSFPEAPTTAGPSSYELLADALDATAQGARPTVLDLGCGDGRLLAILARRRGDGVALVGVDVAPEQIERARRRLAGIDVALRCESAQALSLDAASVDFVLIHMGLALMRPLDAVLREIDRVLKPGGALALVVEREPAPDATDRLYARILWETLVEERPELISAGLIDPRAADAEALARLVRETTALAGAPAVLHFDLVLTVTAAEFVAFAEGDHLWSLLSERGVARVRREVRALFTGAADQRVATPIAMQRLIFRKP